MGKKKKKLNVLGFTLVELLAVITILAVVMSVVMYFTIDTVRTAKNKSYQVTISNIENEVASYVVEQNETSDWIRNHGANTQYQCVTIQDLIDEGYFKGDVLDSYIDDKNKVKASDIVYIERNVYDKVITKNIFLVGKMSEYKGLCDVKEDTKNVIGEIKFNLFPESNDERRYYKKKTIDIYYQLFNYDNLSNYKYDYKFFPKQSKDGSKYVEFDKLFTNYNNVNEKLEVNVNGTLYATIYDSRNGDVIARGSLPVDYIDNEPPVITCNASVAMLKSTKDSKGEVERYRVHGVNECPDYVEDCDKDYNPNECAVYMEPLSACGGSIWAYPNSVLTVTDNSGRYTKNSSGIIINENNVTVENLQHTKCNCDDGFCSWTWTMTAEDEAGNVAEPKSFTYYVTYRSIVTRHDGNLTNCVDEKKIFNNFVSPTCPFK